MIDEEFDIELMNDRIEQTKLKSLESSRQTVKRLKESEHMAEQNLTSLGQQSNQLSNVEVGITKVSLNADKAVNRTEDLKQLNKNFIVSSLNPGKIVTNWKRKRNLKKEEKKIEEVKRYEITKKAETSSRVARIPKSGSRHDSSFDRDHVAPDETHDVHEEEISRNLSYMSDSVRRLKEMSTMMSSELADQNDRLNKTGKDALEMGTKVRTVETRLKKIK
eukprot:NODE_428_length_7645_cov_0.433740.p6 type:complete len:220 gc:universal NODE_428_length_7645_cov_0.433740:5622-4963(-)